MLLVSHEDGWLRTQTQNTLRDQYVKHSILDVLTGKAPTLERMYLKILKIVCINKDMQ